MPVPIIETQYYPSIYTFALAMRYGSLQVEAHENYSKQTYRNRCRIRGANKTQDLSIPINKTAHKIPITESTFDPHGGWLKDHIRSVQSAYGNAPYYEHYEQKIMDCLRPDTDNLFEHNQKTLSVCLDILKLEMDLSYTAEYCKSYQKGAYLDLRNSIHPKKELPVDLGLSDVKYIQAFGSVFVSGLSILDLLFNEGPNSVSVLGAMAGLEH